MTARSDAQKAHQRKPAAVLELDLDYCENEYGVGVCTAGRTAETGTAQSGGASTLQLRAGASGVDNFYTGKWLGLRSGAGAVQARKITGYVGATKVATVSPAWGAKYAQEVLADNPVAYWRLGESSGAMAFDESGNGYHGTYVGGVRLGESGPLQSDDAGTCVRFDGGNITDYFLLDPFNGFPGGNLSCEFWVKCTGSGDGLVAYGGGNNFMFFGQTAINIYMGTNIATGVNVADGEWHHLVLTWVKATGALKLYKDGVEAFSGTHNAGGTITNGLPLFIGQEPDSGTPPYNFDATQAMPGSVCELAFYDAVLSPTRVLEHYQAGIQNTPSASFIPDSSTVYDVIDRSNACYNVFAGDSPCQDPANYVKGVKTIKVCTRGMPIPAGELIRPYLAKVSPTASEISTDKGLAPRSRTSVDMVDEPCRDDLDKYIDDRAAPAGGTFWPRLMARNPNAAGRMARLRRGYVVDPWDWNTFQTELFIIEALQGPNKQDVTTAVLVDLVKLLDRTMIPPPTDGKLLADLAATSDAGTARGGSINTIVLREKASPIDDFYNGQEVFILENTGAGQRRVISDYVGATRTATLATNWQVTPDALSVYEVAPLEFEMPNGSGAQYPSPGAEPEFVKIGKEVIRYTAKSGDKLQWADGSYRAQFGTARDDHKAKDGVQLCRAWVDKPFKTVAQNILNEGGVGDTYIDLAQLAKEDADWLGLARITVCIADPEKSSDLYADLLKDVMMMSWWHPVEQKVKFKVDMPELGGGSFAFTDDQLMLRETDPVRLDEERITRAAVDFELDSATEDLKKRTSYRTIELFVDGVREGANSYGDVRQSLRASRWFTEANEILAKANVARRLRRLGDAPWRIRLKLDPRDEAVLGALGDLTTRKIVTAAGNPKTVRCRVMRLADRGSHFEGELRTTGFQGRYAFIAPAGQPDYGAASEAQRAYWYISNGAVMSDGSPAYIFP